MKFDHVKLKRWFLENKRDLPWRQETSPYAVWVSEVMLQQTQVSVVIPYFLRWMVRYPTLKDLAEAPIDEVIKLWEGLGYYSRARCLHQGSQYVLEHHQGILPCDAEALSKIKGLGPYTVGAILSFAFHQPVPAVDGNVLRVLARYYKIEEDISKPKTISMIRGYAKELLPKEESWIVNEGLIELGATICTKKPKCPECPIKSSCQAFLSGDTNRLPIKLNKIKTEQLFRFVAVVSFNDLFLVRCTPKGEIMSGLHEFPYFETDKTGFTDNTFKEKINMWGLKVNEMEALNEVKHSFTRYRVSLKPVRIKCENFKAVSGFDWKTMEELNQMAFSSGHRRVLQQINKLGKI